MCPVCGVEGAGERDPRERAPLTKESRPVRACDVPLAEPSRVTTGIAPLDAHLGGGLVIPSTVLVGGSPGAGKTTMLAFVAGAIGAALDRPGLVLSGEMPAALVVHAARRVGADESHLWVHQTARWEAAEEHARALRPAAIVLDSLPVFAYADERPGSDAALAGIALAFVALCRDVRAVGMLVAHATSDDMIAGGRYVQHVPDGCAFLNREGILRIEKYRFAPPGEVAIGGYGRKNGPGGPTTASAAR